MLFDRVLVSSLWLASAVLAAHSSRSLARVAHRREGHRSQISRRLEQRTDANSEGVVYHPNWAGAILSEPGGAFSSVTGTLTVPDASGNDGDSAFIWVGFDGRTCEDVILASGILMKISNGQPSYSAWYEWYPYIGSEFTGIKISAGDVVQLTVNASSMTSATVAVENLTNNQTVRQDLTSAYALCGQNAEWIVEDNFRSGKIAPFVNFGTAMFANAMAIDTNGRTYTPEDATIFDIEQNNAVLTSVSVDDSSVTVSYV